MSRKLSQLKILVVDDHPLTRGMLKMVLKQWGFKNVIEANDGEQALALVHNNDDLSLVFTDLHMPTGSGIELIKEIRQKAYTKVLPVIVVSGESDYDMVNQALKAGADTFIVKPFSTQTIKEKIIQVLSKRARPTA